MGTLLVLPAVLLPFTRHFPLDFLQGEVVLEKWHGTNAMSAGMS